MTPERLGFMVGAFIGGAVVGTLCGLIPYFVATKRQQNGLATGGLITCIICGLLGGLILALPVAGVFSAYIYWGTTPPDAE